MNNPSPPPTPFDRFHRLATGVVNVPKSEADKAEAKWRKKKDERKKRKKD